MGLGPTFTKNNYRCIDTGTPYLIKTVAYQNNIPTLTAQKYSPALIFNMAQGSVDQFSLYVPGTQTKPVVPFLLVQTSQGNSATKNLGSSVYSQLDHTLAWVASVVPVAFKIAAQAPYMPATTEQFTSGGGFFFPDLVRSDFITPDPNGTIFPFSNNTYVDAIKDPVSGQSTAHFYPLLASYTDTNIWNYIACAYAELQQ